MTRSRLRASLLILAGWSLVPGCYSGIGADTDGRDAGGASEGGGTGGSGDDGSGGDSEGSGEAAASPVVMRRLTRTEYNNTVRDLVGDDSAPGSIFPPEETVHGFDNNAEALTFPPVLADQALNVATRLAKDVAPRAEEFAPCASTAPDTACAETFIRAFGARAWRRPLTDDEVAGLLPVYEAGSSDGFERGVELTVQSILISAPFFYRVEVGDGTPVAGKPGLVHPTSWEMASRLSYFLWGTMPDDALFDAAERGELGTPEEVLAQAERMLDDPRVHEAVANFHGQWLLVGGIGALDKDPEVFSTWETTTAELLLQETSTFLDHVAFEGGITDLFTAGYSFRNDALAAYYGAEPVGSDAFELVTSLAPERRGGILTQAGVLAQHAAFDQSSPTLRGMFVRERLLCGVLPPPPPDVDNTPAAPGPMQTTRERYEQHANDPSCVGCHRLMDPIGFGLEGYDGAGLFREEEAGMPVDARGEVIDSDVGPFEGGVELGQKLAQSEDVRACIARQWFRFAYGRDEDVDQDGPMLEQIAQVIAESNAYRELLLGLTQTDAFLYLPNPTP